MLFINSNNEYPRYIGDLQIEYPGWKEGDAIPEGWTEVAYAEQIPTPGPDEVVYEDYPELVNGTFVQKFSVRKITKEEASAMNVRLTAKEKLLALGLSEQEIRVLFRGI